MKKMKKAAKETIPGASRFWLLRAATGRMLVVEAFSNRLGFDIDRIRKGNQ